MQITYIPIGELKPYKNNPRKNDNAVDAVAASIKEFGFKVPIVIDKDKEIVAGHTRYKAAVKIGLEKIPCIVADDLTPEQIKAFRLADNKTAELAEWDIDLLNIELGDIQLDMSVFGFDTELPDGEAHEDNYEPEPPIEPITKRGDIYKLGDHILICGDATDTNDYAAVMGDKLCDLILTDPPYNVDYEGGTDKHLKIENDNMSESAFVDFISAAFECAASRLKPGGAYYIFHSDTSGEIFRRAAREHIGDIRQCLIWNKNTIVMGRQDYQWKHEPCLYGWKGGGAHYFIDDRTQSTVYADDPIDFSKLKKADAIKLLTEIYSEYFNTTVINENKPTKNAEHPTMKPVRLVGRLIKNSTRHGETVLDPFGGSGSTLIACEQLGRKCVTIEIDPKYCDVIIDRWETYTGKKAIKLTTIEVEQDEYNNR